MSKDNVAVVRAGIDAFVAGDMEGIGAVYHPDASIAMVPEGWPEPAPIVGRDAVVRQFARLQEDWEEQSMDVERELVEGDWVLVDVHWRTRGAGSGMALSSNVMCAYRIVDGKIAEARFFWDWDEALASIRSSS